MAAYGIPPKPFTLIKAYCTSCKTRVRASVGWLHAPRDPLRRSTMTCTLFRGLELRYRLTFCTTELRPRLTFAWSSKLPRPYNLYEIRGVKDLSNASTYPWWIKSNWWTSDEGRKIPVPWLDVPPKRPNRDAWAFVTPKRPKTNSSHTASSHDWARRPPRNIVLRVVFFLIYFPASHILLWPSCHFDLRRSRHSSGLFVE